VAGLSLSVGCLYPDIMGTYGDRGNVETVLRRCAWRGISAAVIDFRVGDRIDPAALDMIMIGGGGEAQQRLVAADLYKVKSGAIREAVALGAAALAVGCGYELFGRFCQPEDGAEFPGVGLFDAWTIRQTAVLSGQYDTISRARADRAIGELVVQWRESLLVGFENHSGGTYLGPTAQPLGRVIAGHGNNGDGTEGVILGSAVGTHLRGPCLPKNPDLADFLIAGALTRRYGQAELPPLADDLELAAHEVALQRATAAPHRSVRLGAGILARAALGRAALGRHRPARRGPAQSPETQARPAHTVPAQTLPAPTLPAPTLPAPTLPAPTLPARSPAARTLPAQGPPAQTPPAQTPPAESPPAESLPATGSGQ
jgi:lipid II isoglutaminyl synthase (glutamine-hydrolysing)